MHGPRPTPITVSDRQRAVLQSIPKRHTASQRLVRRVRILLALADNPVVESVAEQLHFNRLTVRLWRDRWLQATAILQQAEQQEASESQLLDLIEQILTDAPRPGTPATFTPEQLVQLVAVACEPPEKSGRPIDHWTDRELADELKKRGIVATISPSSVGRFLKGSRPPTAPQPLLAQQQSRRPGGLSPTGHGRL
jgi:putative transposase